MRTKTFIGVLNEREEIIYVYPVTEDARKGKIAKLLELGFEWGSDGYRAGVLKKQYYIGLAPILVKLFPNAHFSPEFSNLVKAKEDAVGEWSYW